MDDYEHLILSEGRYRLLALTPHADFDASRIAGYAVATLAGDRLHVEPTLSQARAWLDERLHHERPVHPPPGRVRR